MAFKLRSGNGGAFKAGQQLWKPPSSEESDNVIENDVNAEPGSEGEAGGVSDEESSAARQSDNALSQLLTPRETRRGGIEKRHNKEMATIRSQRYNQAVDAELGVEGVEGPADFKGFKGEGSQSEAWGHENPLMNIMGMSMFTKKKKYKK